MLLEFMKITKLNFDFISFFFNRNETESCTAHTCPVHGQWGEWKRWSYCNVTCGNGHKTRIRSCDNPKAENGGFDCTGEEKQVLKILIHKFS